MSVTLSVSVRVCVCVDVTSRVAAEAERDDSQTASTSGFSPKQPAGIECPKGLRLAENNEFACQNIEVAPRK